MKLSSLISRLAGPRAGHAFSRWQRQRRGIFSESDMLFETLCPGSRKDGLMIDVGAHYGSELAPYARHGWRVLAFEPDPANRAVLVKKAFGDRVEVIPNAVGETAAAGIPFFSSEESAGISGLSAFRPTHRESAKVDVVTLRDALSARGVTAVDFLKIDTEGHDLFVLRGFPWETTRPDAVFCEFEDSKTLPLGYSFRTMGDLLIQQGYRVLLSEWHPIERYGVSHRWRRLVNYPADLAQPEGWGNFIALHRDVHLRRAQAYLDRVGQPVRVA